ncbi:MAG: ferrous iron transport protein A [Gammaproteobacteria bacterium]|nr:MAG: ferrous iron transport protein A [Gammaproteobacteria bacterium]
MSHSPTATTLLMLDSGHQARITGILGGRNMTRRMLALGLRVGTVINILNRRGRGIVIGNAGTRVALGAGIADKLLVEPVD